MEVHFYLSSGKISVMSWWNLGIALLPSLLALLSAVKHHPPTLSLLVPRNVSKFAGPCETSPGCFGSPSSHSCTVPVVQVSCICFGFFLDWWGGLRMGLYLRLIAEIKKELSVQLSQCLGLFRSLIVLDQSRQINHVSGCHFPFHSGELLQDAPENTFP